MDAQEALKIGLVNVVVAEESLLEEAMAMCHQINAHSALALKLSRHALDQGLHRSFEQTLELEASHLLMCINSAEQQKYVEKKLSDLKHKDRSD